MLSKQTKHYLIQTIVSGLSSFIFIWVASLCVDQQSLGNYLLTLSYALVIAGIANFGLIFGYERGYFEFDGNIKKQFSLLSSLFYFSSTIFTFFILALFLFPDSIYLSIGVNKSHYLLLFSGACAYILQQYFTTHYRCEGDSKRYMIFASLPQLFLVPFFLILFLSFGSSTSLYMSYFLSHLSVLAILLIYNGRYLVGLRSLNSTLLVETIEISLPMTPRVVLGLIGNQIDKIFVGELIGPVVLTAYAIAQSLAVATFQFMTALARVFQPGVYRICFGKLSTDNLESSIVPPLILSLLFAFCVSIGSYHVLYLGFDEVYANLSSTVNILIFGYVLIFIGKISGIQLSVSKKLLYTAIGPACVIAVNLIAIEPLYTKYSINGAALAFVFSQVSGTLIIFLISQKFLALPFPFKKIIFLYVAFSVSFFLYNLSVADSLYLVRLFLDFTILAVIFIYVLKSKVGHIMGL